MPTPHKNNWKAKIKRNLCAIFLPVAKNRQGQCNRCGACCKLPKPCPFLGYQPDGKAFCRIQKLKPLTCKKYPQMEHHQVTRDVCGYWFEKED